ncbi:MAG: winged helix-turn-helix domain-containing protein [Micromonosporaceae bacterium]|uniref:Transcriptional regulator n=1 Tax=Thermocrispum agreste TaxID=37925 RepID=A0A2W4LAQ7_9PSEU|nr:MAG: transcriptional regulator [Thermocrispum agreste]
MQTAQSIARFAGLLADRSRVAICLALLDGRAWTAGELARHARIGRSTASEHITLLVGAGLLTERRQGRHRYLCLAGPHVAQLIEDLGAAVGEPERPMSLRAVRAAGQLAAARTCYDHLAGALGVALFDALVAAGFIAVRDGLVLTPAGRDWFTGLAGDAALRARGSRPLVRACLDWTERRDHLGGLLGAVLCRQFVERGWLNQVRNSRAVTVTPAGGRALSGLGVRVPAVCQAA